MMFPPTAARRLPLAIGTILSALAIITACSSGTYESSEMESSNNSHLPSKSGDSTTNAEAPVTKYSVEILETLPTDPDAFIQGLTMTAPNEFLVSTGQKGHSEIFRMRTPGTNGQTIDKTDIHSLDDRYFGEGSAQIGDTVWQLTWKAGKAFRYDAAGLQPVNETDYSGEGWGLCFDGKTLVMSNGSDELVERDPNTFDAGTTLHAHMPAAANNGGTGTLSGLNELDCSADRILANVFTQNQILIMDRADGTVTGWIDASSLAEREEAEFRQNETDASQFRKKMWNTKNAVLNGIASDPTDPNVLYLTGKTWSHIYKVKLISEETGAPS